MSGYQHLKQIMLENSMLICSEKYILSYLSFLYQLLHSTYKEQDLSLKNYS